MVWQWHKECLESPSSPCLTARKGWLGNGQVPRTVWHPLTPAGTARCDFITTLKTILFHLGLRSATVLCLSVFKVTWSQPSHICRGTCWCWAEGGAQTLFLPPPLSLSPLKPVSLTLFFFFNTTNPFLPLSSTSCLFFSNYALWSYIGNPGQVNNSVTLIKKLFGLTASIYFSQNTVFPLMVTLQLNTWNQAHISHRDILWYLLETKVSWRDDYSSSCNLHTDRLVSSEIMCGRKGEFNAAFLPQQIHG